MSAPLVELADQITDLINTPGGLTPAPSAIRRYQVFFELPDLTTVKVVVQPMSDKTIERGDRGAWKHELTVQIAVQKKLSGDDDPSKDVVYNLADDTCQYVKENWPEESEFELVDATVASVMQHPMFQQNRIFSSAVELKYWQFL